MLRCTVTFEVQAETQDEIERWAGRQLQRIEAGRAGVDVVRFDLGAVSTAQGMEALAQRTADLVVEKMLGEA